MSMKSQRPPQRPVQFPRWMGSVVGFAVADRKTGFAPSASSVTTTVWSQALAFPVPPVEGKLMAISPGSPPATTGKFACVTPGGAIIFGGLQVFPWSVVSVDDIHGVAHDAGLEATGLHRFGDRWCAVLEVGA